MATVTKPGSYGATAPAQVNYLNNSHGFLSWIFTLDHKRIGLMYLGGVMTMFLLGGIFALLVRIELWQPGVGILGVLNTAADTKAAANAYNKLFTLHGAVMVFLVIIPSIPAALGNFVLPIMLGAKDVAFPRLNLLSFHFWIFGAFMFVCVLLWGGLDTGWTFYAPYSQRTTTPVIAATFGAFILGFSSIFTGINFIVTTHTLRAKGMGWFKIPLFVWALYGTAVIQVLATPVLAITLLLLMVEKAMGIGVFDPSRGGDPVLYQHFFWFYSHPAVYIMILPAMGVISELMATFSRKHIFGYRLIAFSSVAIALLGFLVWGHHMYTSGQSELAGTIFSAITFTIAIPSAIKVFNWLFTMYKGSVSFQSPMCFALAFLFLFAIGGLTGLFLATMSTDVPLHDTYFVVAHFHYVMVGSAITAMYGGLFYWWPKIWGKMPNEFWGRVTALLIFTGFNVTFFPQFILGTRGMPRRYFNYLPEYTELHQWSTVGAVILGVGAGVGMVTLIYAIFRGKPAPMNPWGGATLEWQCSSPPPLANFDTPPVVHDPYDMQRVVYDARVDGYVPNPNYKPSDFAH
ncbi:MAG: cbb3-type cytochrome c oxidase subunit I [Pirellulales bacterium]|nr:cbb3-type cytochrome c oxidase subunit I [Pirellulales bacterium]